ncbi:cytochrome c-type biogenesis protein [Halopseudomonas sp.]|uniref:cytochrome c-type biogenesis protein n=1 Tax=Halopseudomonas sp. TaxID=2901191 RepID=UPI00356800A5
MIRVPALMVLFALLLASFGALAIDTYEFDSEEQRERFYYLSTELRCPKCQNQNIADSNAPIATDLRREIYRMLQEDRSNEEIIDFMVARYGEFVRYRPALTAETAVLWFAPAVFLIVGLLVLVVMLRRRQKAFKAGGAEHLSSEDQQRLKTLLENKDRND